MQSVFSYFIRTFGAVLMFTVFFGNAVFADTCEPGQYMAFAMESSAYGDYCEHECEPCNCADGQTCDGTGWYNYDCPNMELGGDKGCTDLCLGYDDCPEGVGDSGKKCKEVSDCPNGCHKYEICDTTTGEISQYMDGNCHMEGNTCYANTRECKMFYIDRQHGNWECQQSQQTGNAEWDSDLQKWYVGDCTCSFSDRDINSVGIGDDIIKCQKAAAEYIVWPGMVYENDVGGAIYYVPTRMYCDKCYPGFLPDIVAASETWQNAGISITTRYNPGTNNTWGVWKCKTPVTAPNYADGCVIDWTKPTGNAAINACKKSCDAGMIIDEDGATGPDWCEVDPSQRFTDNTGMFIIGEGQCSTPGGGGG